MTVHSKVKQSQDRTSLVGAYRRLLTQYLFPQRDRAIWMALLMLGTILAQLASPQIIRYFLDTAQSGGTVQTLLNAALIYIGFALLQQAFRTAATYISQMVAWVAANRLRTDLTLHCLKLDMGFHKRHTPGEMIERIDGDVSQLGNFFSQLIVDVLSNGLLIIGILVMLFIEDPRVGLGMTVYTFLTLATLSSIQHLATTRWGAARQAITEQNGFLEERISGVEDIQVSAAEGYTYRRFQTLLQAVINHLRIAFVIGQLSYNLTRLVYVIGFAIGLGLGVYLYQQGQATVGAAYLIVYYVGMLSDPLQSIRREVQDLQQASASVQRVEALLGERPAVEDGQLHKAVSGTSWQPEMALPICFENVSFRYKDETVDQVGDEETRPDTVLTDIDFRLAPGKILGVLGRTGSGKTTMTRLMFRLYDPSSGTIRLGDTDLRQFPLSELRHRVGLVTQDVQLFEASVRDNLTFFDSSVSNERLEVILHDLQLWDWINSLPNGLNTRLAYGGQGLSAGEAQLLAFARVFLKQPGLVVLDEASSRLDPATEARMEQAVDRLFHGRTGIVIAHRLRTVERADDILILDQGRVVEYGARMALAADPQSHYATLLRTGLEEVMA